MMSEEPKKKFASVMPFTIEADGPRNNDLLIQCIPNCKLRSAVSSSKPTIRNKQDEEMPTIPKDQARHLGMLPPIPGMQLTVDPANCVYVIYDPLTDNPELCKRIVRGLQADDRPYRSGKLAGVPTKKGTLDKHRMKSLCRECFNIIQAGHAKVVKGTPPEMEDIEELDGDFLLNPGSRVPNGQPIFEKDYDGYVENLQKTGG